MKTERQGGRARVIWLAAQVLGSPARAARWLQTPNQDLNGDAPNDRLDSAAGAWQVEQLLRLIDRESAG